LGILEDNILVASYAPPKSRLVLAVICVPLYTLGVKQDFTALCHDGQIRLGALDLLLRQLVILELAGQVALIGREVEMPMPA